MSRKTFIILVIESLVGFKVVCRIKPDTSVERSALSSVCSLGIRIGLSPLCMLFSHNTPLYGIYVFLCNIQNKENKKAYRE